MRIGGIQPHPASAKIPLHVRRYRDQARNGEPKWDTRSSSGNSQDSSGIRTTATPLLVVVAQNSRRRRGEGSGIWRRRAEERRRSGEPPSPAAAPLSALTAASPGALTAAPPRSIAARLDLAALKLLRRRWIHRSARRISTPELWEEGSSKARSRWWQALGAGTQQQGRETQPHPGLGEREERRGGQRGQRHLQAPRGGTEVTPLLRLLPPPTSRGVAPPPLVPRRRIAAPFPAGTSWSPLASSDGGERWREKRNEEWWDPL